MLRTLTWRRYRKGLRVSAFLDIDKRHIWHPFTQHATERDPVVVTRAKGASLFDEEGNEILDLISSWWTCIHGHAHTAIVETIAKQAGQLEHVMFAGFTHPPAAKLAQALAGRIAGRSQPRVLLRQRLRRRSRSRSSSPISITATWAMRGGPSSLR